MTVVYPTLPQVLRAGRQHPLVHLAITHGCAARAQCLRGGFAPTYAAKNDAVFSLRGLQSGQCKHALAVHARWTNGDYTVVIQKLRRRTAHGNTGDCVGLVHRLRRQRLQQLFGSIAADKNGDVDTI